MKSMDRRAFLGMGAGTLGAAALIGKAGASPTGSAILTAAPKPKRGGMLNIGVNAEINGLSPISSAMTTSGLYYGRALFDPIAIVASDGTVKPYLCQSITPNADYSAWTFKARPGITFHDGTPLDGAALANHFQHVIHSAFAALSAFNTVTNINQVDSMTVTLQLSSPWVALPSWLTGAIGTQTGLVAAPAMLANPNGAMSPIGTGPFKFVSWEPGSHLVVERNPNYWQKGLPYLDGITFHPIVDDTSRFQSLQSGTLDLIQMSNPIIVSEMLADPSLNVLDNLKAPPIEPSQSCILLNTAQVPLNDLRVRRALAYATDQQAVIRVFGAGLGSPSTGLFSPGTKYYNKTNYPQYNLKKAKALVADYTASTGKAPTFTMQIAGTTYTDLAQQLQQMWKKAGINLSTINTMEQTAYNANIVSGNYFSGAQQQFEAADPDQNYDYWSLKTIGPVGSTSINFSRYSNQAIQDALQTGRSDPNPKARIKAYQTVSDQLAEFCPFIWITRQIWGIGYAKNVRNLNNVAIPGSTVTALPLMQGDVWMQQIWLA